MKLIRNFQNINQDLKNTILTLGNFDGLHLGHQQILKEVRKITEAKNSGWLKKFSNHSKFKSALLTFEPHTTKVTNPKKAENIRITSLAQKLQLIKNSNLADIVFVANFNRKLADFGAEEFVEKILVDQLKISHLLIGYDFTFGKNRSGNAELLKEMSKIHNFDLTIIPANKNNEQQIYSSTKIRGFIANGNINEANIMLGRKHLVSGMVITGKKIARNLGFPTANFLPKIDSIRPKYGVYKAEAVINKKKYQAIINFGIKPTFNNDLPLFEAHIFDFNQEIYGQKINCELIEFIREEKKFVSVSQLQEQITKDCFLVKNSSNIKR